MVYKYQMIGKSTHCFCSIKSRKKEIHYLMFVVKRKGFQENVQLDKITSRIDRLCSGLNRKFVIPIHVTLRVVNSLYSGVTTQEVDNLAAETAATMTTEHVDYSTLAARIAISNLHK